MKKVALIPSYEPNEKLIDILKELKEKKFEIVLVNDGSDKSYNKIFNRCKKYCKYLSYDENHGKGYALKTGLKYIEKEYKDVIVITMDSDGQHTVKDAINLCNVVSKKDNTILLGKRLRSSKTPLRSRLGNAITRFAYRISTGVDIYDTQTGLRAFKSDLIPFLIDVEGERFEYEMNVLLDAPKKGIALEEEIIETIYEDNNSGTHFNTLRDSYLIYKQIIKFISSSVLSFIVDYILYVIGTIIFNSVITANIFARVISSTFNYTVNRSVVFKDKGNIKNSIIKYYLLAICILVVNTSLLYLFVDIVGLNKYLIKILIEIVLFIVSYSVQKRFIFKD